MDQKAPRLLFRHWVVQQPIETQLHGSRLPLRLEGLHAHAHMSAVEPQRPQLLGQLPRALCHRMPPRIVALLDMDCFYAQVEARRLGIGDDEPLGVRQWTRLVAVNYRARENGVKRGDAVEEARAKCPRIHLPHVPLIGPGASAEATQETEMVKVSLARYRKASTAVFAILKRMCSSVERASIDEAYLDLTDVCSDVNTAEHEALEAAAAAQSTVAGRGWTPSSEHDYQLAAASELMDRIRATIKHELGYSCSAGIAHCKSIAKRVASFNKPNGQTLCPKSQCSQFLASVPLTSMRLLGAKLGQQLLELLPRTGSDPTPADVSNYLSLAFLQEELGSDTGAWVWNYCQGIDDDPVKPRTERMSLVSAKQFGQNPQDRVGVNRWIRVLASELMDRIEEEVQENQRVPSSLVLAIYDTTVRTPISIVPDRIDLNSILVPALRLLARVPSSSPCRGITLSAASFVSIAAPRDRITAYLGAGGGPVCDRCGATVDDIQEHADYHMAMDLASAQTRTEPSKSSKRKRGQPTLDSFFT